MAGGTKEQVRLANNVIGTGALTPVGTIGAGRMAVEAYGTTTAGAGAATIAIQVSNDGLSWITAGTISLTLGTTSVSDGFTMDAPWGLIRANVTAISGTNATVSVLAAA